MGLNPKQKASAVRVMKALKLAHVNASVFSTAAQDCGQVDAAPCWIPLYDKLATMLANDDPWPAAVTPELYKEISHQVC